MVHLFDRPHDGAVVGSAEQGCPQSDEDQEDGSTADGDAREQGEGRQSQGRQDQTDRAMPRGPYLSDKSPARGDKERHDDGLHQQDGPGHSRRQAENDLEIEG